MLIAQDEKAEENVKLHGNLEEKNLFGTVIIIVDVG